MNSTFARLPILCSRQGSLFVTSSSNAWLAPEHSERIASAFVPTPSGPPFCCGVFAHFLTPTHSPSTEVQRCCRLLSQGVSIGVEKGHYPLWLCSQGLPRALQPPESPTNTPLKWASEDLSPARCGRPHVPAKRERGRLVSLISFQLGRFSREN